MFVTVEPVNPVAGVSSLELDFKPELVSAINDCVKQMMSNPFLACITIEVGSHINPLGSYRLLNSDGCISNFNLGSVVLNLLPGCIIPVFDNPFTDTEFKCGLIGYSDLNIEWKA